MKPHLLTFITAIGLCVATAAGEDDKPAALATWAFGIGTQDGRAATLNAPITAGQAVVAGPQNAVRLDLNGFKDSRLIVSAGGVITLAVEPGAKPDTKLLVVQLDKGSVQVDVNGTGPFESLRVRGAAADVRVTGTLFVVERVQRDTDFVALVKGRLKVGLRRSVAEALNKNEEIDLGPRQGLAIGINGLGSVVGLSNRPSVPTTAAAAATSSVQEKSTANAVGDGGWNRDQALTDTLTGATATTTDPVNPGVTTIETATTAAIAESAVREAAAVQVTTELSSDLSRSVLQELNLGGAVINEVLRAVSTSELAGPPGPPR